MIRKSFNKQSSQSGFTIVELLIVIVVIGILAAITIVAYNGIQNRAHAAQAQAAASNLSTLLANYNTLNGSYPTDLSTINNNGPLSTTDGTTYAYHPGASNTSFCVTVTNATASYVITDSNTAPASGGCPGDGQGGMAAITNLVKNPNLTSLNYMSGSGTATNTLETTSPASGTTFGRRTYTAAAASASIYFGNFTGIQPGHTYTASAMVRASKSTSLKLTIDWKASGGAYIGSVSGPTQTVGTSWTLLTANGVAQDPTTTQVTLTVPGSGWAIGDYVDLDSVMLVDGPATGNFADGSTSSWIWNGTANNSTSTGPIQ
jgi:prepilin-type N-terminal cleavage/methylation domain-containing protein